MTLGAAMIDEELLSILVCPADRGPLVLVDDTNNQLLYNPRLRRGYRIEDNIPVLLVVEATEVGDDEHARLIAKATPPHAQGGSSAGSVRWCRRPVARVAMRRARAPGCSAPSRRPPIARRRTEFG